MSSIIRAAVGKVAPHFKATAWVSSTQQFQDIDLNDFKKKWVLLFFYPLDFTFVCPTEITAFSDQYSRFKENDCEVFGVSVDSKFVHRQYTLTPKEDGGLGKVNLPLISDQTREISDKYGLLTDAGVALRGTYLIENESQIVRHMSINDLSVGRNVAEYLRLLAAFKLSKKSGSVCPASFTVENQKDTMNPTFDGLKDYWKKK